MSPIVLENQNESRAQMPLSNKYANLIALARSEITTNAQNLNFKSAIESNSPVEKSIPKKTYLLD